MKLCHMIGYYYGKQISMELMLHYEPLEDVLINNLLDCKLVRDRLIIGGVGRGGGQTPEPAIKGDKI